LLGEAAFLAASATDAFIAAFFWQPLSGGAMIEEIGQQCGRRLFVS
jgi:hypothetical protein